MIMNKLNVEQSFYLITFYTFYNVQTHISRGNVQNLNNHFQGYSVSFMVCRKIYEPHKWLREFLDSQFRIRTANFY